MKPASALRHIPEGPKDKNPIIAVLAKFVATAIAYPIFLCPKYLQYTIARMCTPLQSYLQKISNKAYHDKNIYSKKYLKSNFK